MKLKADERHDETIELGTASVETLGNLGPFPEKEVTMHNGGISDE